MATNLVRKLDDWPGISVVVTHPTTPASGDPVRYGSLTGVALTDEGDGGNGATETTVDFGAGVWDINVDDDAGTGIAVGAKLYYQDTGTGSPATSVNNNSTTPEGVFGIALEALGANATGTIRVLHLPQMP
jgi:predicted RecA/RadA family phage recombinase